MKSIKKQAGFTLVEIAIVLVIVGLLLVGVLKGQELIDSARVKNTINDMEGIVAATASYTDRYKALPGDDGPTATITPRGGSWATMVGTAVPNGSIADTVLVANTFVPSATGVENELFFRHLRAGGYITGDPAATLVNALPLNAWGGRTGIINIASIQSRPAAARLMLCLGSVPGKAAAALDRQLDDGIPNTGAFRANAGNGNTLPAAAGVASYDETLFYTVCRDFP
jgi:prepilin-type N-terminal cleavage/methylation domain-containing protein